MSSRNPPDRLPSAYDVDAVTARLVAERRQTSDRLERLRGDYAGIVDASRDTNADDEHDPEGATIAYERSQVQALVAQAERHLVGIDAALQRVVDGSHGICEICGTHIPPARLEARPTAVRCLACAR